MLNQLITKEISGKRLDQYLSEITDKTRSNITKHIKLGDILVNGNKVKAGYILNENDSITINDYKEETTAIPEDIPLDIYYEDNDVIVINKPSGMVVHPANGNYTGTLVNALVGRKELSDINGEDRPGIVHRIDKDTSGLLLIAKNDEAHNILAEDFKNKNITRKYIALVSGVIEENSGKINAPIGRSKKDRKKMDIIKDGKKAITNFKVIERYKNATLIECKLETGRTHQIRVHMAYIHHPVINDPVYGKSFDQYGQLLHAAVLGFNHPKTHKYLEFTSPLPDKFVEILNKYKNE